jgi:phage terminase large subunit-like protein
MGTTFLEEEFAADYRDALTDPRKMSRWLRYSLNVWTERDNRWFHGEEFARCQVDPPEPLDGRPCWVGLDLADHNDLTAAVFLFRSDDGTFDAELLAWVPAEGMAEREKRDGVPYSTWVRDGWLRVTEGSRIDQERIYSEIQERLDGHECRGVFGDPWHLDWIATKLQADGVEVHKVRQSIGYLTGPSKMLEDLVKTQRIRYRSPIMSWCANNVCIWEDPNGNIRPDKAKSSEKVDAIFALINALAGASTDAEPEGSDFTLHAL